MGSLYKTSAISPQDYMYQLPAEMMLKVLDFNEGQTDDIYNKSDLFNKSLLSIKSILPDSEDVSRIQKDYGAKIDGITKQLSQDATQWRKYRQPLQDLGREIQQDFTTGEVSQIQKNYELVQEYDKTLAEAVKNKSISPMTARVYKAKALSDFSKTSYDKVTNSGKTFNGLTPMADIDLNERMGKYVDKALADENITFNSTVGKWFITDSKNGTKELSEEKLLSAILPKLMGDQELLGYLNERSQVGLMNGVFNEEGNLDVFKLSDRMKDGVPIKDEQGNVLQKIDYSQNPLAKAIQGTVNERKYFSTQRGVTGTSANPYTTQSINHSQQWAMQKDRQEYETKVKEAENVEKTKKDEFDKALKLADEYRKLGKTKEAAQIINSLSGNFPIVVKRPNEKAFSPHELQNMANEYTALVNNPVGSGPINTGRLAELEKIFGGAAKRLNIENKVIGGVEYSGSTRYGDALDFANGNLDNFIDKPQNVKFGAEFKAVPGQKVSRDAEGKITNLNARGIEAERLAKQISKSENKNAQGVQGVFEELSKNVEQQGQPQLALDKNTKIGNVGLNLMDAMLSTNSYNIYLGDVAHSDGKGNLKPSNAEVKDIISTAIKGGKKLSESFTEVLYKPEGNRGVYTGKMMNDDEEVEVKIVVDGVNEALLPYMNDPKFLENPGAKEFAMYTDPYMYSLGSQVRSRMPYVDMGIEQKVEVGGKPAYTIRQGADGYEIQTENKTIKSVDGQPLTKESIPIIIRQLETNKK